MPESASNDIDLWLVDDREILDSTVLDQYSLLLNDEESRRHQRLVFKEHRHQFLVARALVRTVLAQYLGIDDPASLEFTSNDDGKPELVPRGSLQFNLTHTNGLIALAVMQNNHIGIDVEYLSRQADIVSLCARYFSVIETQALHVLPVEQWNDRFFDLWTLKEAFLKACGTGLRTPLRQFSFTLGEDSVTINFSADLDEDPAQWRFWLLDIEQAYRLALAVHDRKGNNYRLTVRKGIPIKGFTEITPTVIRRSLR